MAHETTNALTLGILLLPWVLWFAWEIFVLVRRGQDVRVKTISMVARDYRFKLVSVLYLWSSMASHWWWPAPAWAPAWLGVAFWVVSLVLVVWDVILWKTSVEEWPTWLKVVRWPLAWLALGFLAGHFLFPQMAQ